MVWRGWPAGMALLTAARRRAGSKDTPRAASLPASARLRNRRRAQKLPADSRRPAKARGRFFWFQTNSGTAAWPNLSRHCAARKDGATASSRPAAGGADLIGGGLRRLFADPLQFQG